MTTFLERQYGRLTADKGFTEILAGTAWAMVSRAGTTALALVGSLLITRLYGAESMGILALVTSVLGMVTVFTVLGTGTSILRMIPEHIARNSPASAFNIYRKTQCLVAGVSVITGLLLLAFARPIASGIFSKPHLAGLVAASAGVVLFKSIMELNQQAVRGLKLIRTYAVLQLLPSLALVVLLLVGLKWKTPTLPAYAQLTAWVITGIAGAVIMNRAFRRRLQPGDIPGDIPGTIPAGSILGLSLPMLLTASMNIIISQTGIILLGMTRSAAEVGYYAVAVKLATITAFVLSSINTMSAPRFSELYHQGRSDELLRIARKSTRLIFWTTAPILLGLLVSGKPVLQLFRPEFKAAYPAMCILVAGQFINSISGSTGYFMNMTGHHCALRNIKIAAALINVTMNLILTPRFGITGSASAACTSMICWNLAEIVIIKRMFGRSIGYFPGVGAR